VGAGEDVAIRASTTTPFEGSVSKSVAWFVAPRAHIDQVDRSAPPAQGVERTNADRGRPRERSRRQSFEHHAQLPRVIDDGHDGVAIFDDGGGAKPVARAWRRGRRRSRRG